MSAGYRAVQWTNHKRVYDAIVTCAIVLFIAAHIVVSAVLHPPPGEISGPILFIRATGTCALVLLHLILCIGPLSRLDRRFLPLLYNRRHLGVMTFLVALVHGVLVLGFLHGFGNVNPLISLLTNSGSAASLRNFPFEWLGAAALLILFLLAATSHDFWLKNLSSTTWKRLHMLVYVAYALLIGHVALGALQTDRSALLPTLMFLGAAIVIGLHVVAGLREVRRDGKAASSAASPPDGGRWIDAGDAASIPHDRARIVCAAGGERIAVFRHAGGISAVTNVCAHQGGPLGEGRIIDGCITCPWHGWQYRPEDGRSPPPFEEKIATYQVRIVAGRVQVNAEALPPGTRTTAAPAHESSDHASNNGSAT